MILLPFPYDSNCSSQVKDSMSRCNFKCLMTRLRKFNRIPSTEVVLDPHDMVPVTPSDLNVEIDPDRAENISKVHRDCSELCKKPKCYFNFTMTHLETRSIPGTNMTLIPVTALAPTFRVKAVANIALIEFLVYIGSSFGMWFGLSLWSTNPFRSIFQRNTIQGTRVILVPTWTLFRPKTRVERFQMKNVQHNMNK